MESRSGSFNDGVKVEHLYTKRLYHGTTADLNPGDIIEPRGNWINGKYSTEPEDRRAYASGDPDEAREWGAKKGGKAKVYRVAYQPDETPNRVPDTDAPRYTSRQGFKVIERAD